MADRPPSAIQGSKANTPSCFKFIAPIAGLILLATPVHSQTSAPNDESRLLRFPATNGRQVVFSYASQLYTVGLEGGASPADWTNGPGYAVFPRYFRLTAPRSRLRPNMTAIPRYI